ncbi:MAG TPA: XrtA/PEP-CTERM system-associated ATPase [Burkholderiales bacterium]|jgi:putative secretion ATPase, PEP-CTERM locus subfamily|nr:XrtA/PEP-CTERM system-associated ATPase [Steroidobacteraceae bacterium]
MYESFYGLSGKPFQLNPDPAFYYASRGHKRAFAYLQYGLFQGEGFIVITGEVGAGKTTLLRGLLEQLDGNKVVAAQLVSTHLDADDMLKAIAASFGLPIKSAEKAQLLVQLESYFVTLATKRKRALLIVDEAQNLTPRAVEELRMLSNFQLDNHALLQSFLIGQPELRETMRSPHMQQLRQRVLASYHLGPLDQDEGRAYIEHRLRRVGWQGDPAFDNDTFEEIHRATKGIPRRINTLCNRLMMSGYLGEKHRFEAGDVLTVAEEIKDELGVELSPASDAQSTRADPGPAVATGAMNTGFPRVPQASEFGGGELTFDPEHANHARQLLSGSVLSGLEGRITNLEQTLHATLSLLQQLAQAHSTEPAETAAENPRR